VVAYAAGGRREWWWCSALHPNGRGAWSEMTSNSDGGPSSRRTKVVAGDDGDGGLELVVADITKKKVGVGWLSLLPVITNKRSAVDGDVWVLQVARPSGLTSRQQQRRKEKKEGNCLGRRQKEVGKGGVIVAEECDGEGWPRKASRRRVLWRRRR
jgi:hypothetical protein